MLYTVYWLTCDALCKATADILAMPRATLGRTAKEMMTILQGEIQFFSPEGTGDRLCSACWPCGILVHSPVPHKESPWGNMAEDMLCEPWDLQQGVCDVKAAVWVFTSRMQHETFVLCRPSL